ncbi:MAG: cytochrome c oxidase subunit II [Polyangiaceae bacterium]
MPPVFDPHSPEARAISVLFAQTLVVCAAIGLLVAVLVGYCVVRFRARPGDPAPAENPGNKRLEAVWTAVPLGILVLLFILTARTVGAADPPVDREPDLVVVGHQWWWEATYKEGAVTANEIHIPVGRKVLVRIESADVIHDFWVPQLARKIDAIPGHPGFIWMEADAPGPYVGTCAEYCGVEHAWMRILVIAEPQAEFDAWLAHESHPASALSSDEAAARGAKVFQEKTCINCHAVAGSAHDARVAPSLTHLAERKTLGAGVIGNTPADLAHWLRDPQGVKQGCHMPNLNLTDPEVNDLVTYLETLK